jgi:hypothetical protein
MMCEKEVGDGGGVERGHLVGKREEESLHLGNFSVDVY